MNLAGAFVLGALLEHLAARGPDEGRRRALRLTLGTGFCGGFTTYSALAVDTDGLLRAGQAGPALAYALGTVALGLAASALGIAVGPAPPARGSGRRDGRAPRPGRRPGCRGPVRPRRHRHRGARAPARGSALPGGDDARSTSPARSSSASSPGSWRGSCSPASASLVLGTGFLGGYTTFSTAAYETVRLAEQRRWAAALAHGLGQVVLATALAALGYLVGSAA